MQIAMFSNFLNHHQLSLCEALVRLTNGKFIFVATQCIPEERLRLGYQDMNCAYPFVLRTYEADGEREALKLAEEADVMIFGSAPDAYLEYRLKTKKLCFLYSERLYKTGYERWKWPVRMLRFWKKYGRHKSLYLLCASAFCAADYAKTYTFLGKAYRWGYFPKTHLYDDVSILRHKEASTILWAARFLDWKHPEQVVELARKLKVAGYDFHIQMLGNGEKWEAIAQQVQAYGLQEQVRMIGAVPAGEVRSYMDAATIFLFTSDKNEGWGAVLNEAMNSGCAAVASDAIGAVPFLLEDGKNGLIYKSGNVDELYEKVKFLLDHSEKRKEMGTNAYETVTTLWNAETAAQRLLELSQQILNGGKQPDLYKTGPCSKAPILNHER